MSQTQLTAYSCPRSALFDMALGLVGGAFLTLIVVVPLPDRVGPSSGSRTRACDQAVGTLLSSNDLVEVQRSGIIIQALECDVSSRLPWEP